MNTAIKPMYEWSDININHDVLLSKLNTYPTLRRQIRAWLKAGVMDGNKLFPTNEVHRRVA
jgi:hypothetical protein